MAGRKPLPTALKLADGTFRINPERQNKLEPESPTGAPPKPKDLTPAASAKWDEIVGIMRGLNTLSPIYADSIRLYCETWATYRDAFAKVEIGGLVVTYKEDGHLVTKRNQWEVVMSRSRHELTRLAAELGLTPSSKQKTCVTTPKNVVSNRKAK